MSSCKQTTLFLRYTGRPCANTPLYWIKCSKTRTKKQTAATDVQLYQSGMQVEI